MVIGRMGSRGGCPKKTPATMPASEYSFKKDKPIFEENAALSDRIGRSGVCGSERSDLLLSMQFGYILPWSAVASFKSCRLTDIPHRAIPPCCLGTDDQACASVQGGLYCKAESKSTMPIIFIALIALIAREAESCEAGSGFPFKLEALASLTSTATSAYSIASHASPLHQSQFSAPPVWYSMTRVSKKFRSFFRSIISLIQGKGFSS
jgi:hypothetical protein